MITISKFRRPGLGGIFDFDSLPVPKFPPLDLPLDAGSPSPVDGGGADGGGEPVPAPPPGVEVPAADFQVFDVPSYQLDPQYAYPVQVAPTPTTAPVIVQTPAPAIPTWVIAGGAALAGIALTALILRK